MFYWWRQFSVNKRKHSIMGKKNRKTPSCMPLFVLLQEMYLEISTSASYCQQNSSDFMLTRSEEISKELLNKTIFKKWGRNKKKHPIAEIQLQILSKLQIFTKKTTCHPPPPYSPPQVEMSTQLSWNTTSYWKQGTHTSLCSRKTGKKQQKTSMHLVTIFSSFVYVNR